MWRQPEAGLQKSLLSSPFFFFFCEVAVGSVWGKEESKGKETANEKKGRRVGGDREVGFTDAFIILLYNHTSSKPILNPRFFFG